MKNNQKNKNTNLKLNLKLYRPNVNESTMLLETLDKTVAKILVPKRQSLAPTLKAITAIGAKQFIQNVYLLTETYTPELVTHGIEAIINSDITNLDNYDLAEAYSGLTRELMSIYKGLLEIESSMTAMFRSVPIHYRVGYMFRDSNAKQMKIKIKALIGCFESVLNKLQASYSHEASSNEVVF